MCADSSKLTGNPATNCTNQELPQPNQCQKSTILWKSPATHTILCFMYDTQNPTSGNTSCTICVLQTNNQQHATMMTVTHPQHMCTCTLHTQYIYVHVQHVSNTTSRTKSLSMQQLLVMYNHIADHTQLYTFHFFIQTAELHRDQTCHYTCGCPWMSHTTSKRVQAHTACAVLLCSTVGVKSRL